MSDDETKPENPERPDGLPEIILNVPELAKSVGLKFAVQTVSVAAELVVMNWDMIKGMRFSSPEGDA